MLLVYYDLVSLCRIEYLTTNFEVNFDPRLAVKLTEDIK